MPPSYFAVFLGIISLLLFVIVLVTEFIRSLFFIGESNKMSKNWISNPDFKNWA